MVAEGARGSFALPPSAHTRDEWLVILCLPAFPFQKPPLETQYLFTTHTHASHNAHYSRIIINVSQEQIVILTVVLVQWCRSISWIVLPLPDASEKWVFHSSDTQCAP